MDRAQLLLFGLPIFIFFSDLVSIFTPPQSLPPKSNHNHPHLHQQRPQPHLGVSQTLNFPIQKASGFGGIGVGNTININFWSSCSYRFILVVSYDGTRRPLEKNKDLEDPSYNLIIVFL
ncbi:selT-like protein isoform X1 [Malania oleifera]|uniref:selT-like protein isoform X1 n=1 Tax=Malania oleifera TaxID=397392 RepID=UPI0025AE0FFA|nr:selT-like protein isoform X1 [Malania oleifera]